MNPDINPNEKVNGDVRRLNREIEMWKARVTKLTSRVNELQATPIQEYR